MERREREREREREKEQVNFEGEGIRAQSLIEKVGGPVQMNRQTGNDLT